MSSDSDGHDSSDDDTVCTQVSSLVPQQRPPPREPMTCSTCERQIHLGTERSISMDNNSKQAVSSNPARSPNTGKPKFNHCTNPATLSCHPISRHAGPSYTLCTQTAFCRNMCSNCKCKLEPHGIDVYTQVRPRIPMPSCHSNDMTTIARSLEGHYCMLYKVMSSLRQQHAESMTGQHDIVTSIQQIVEKIDQFFNKKLVALDNVPELKSILQIRSNMLMDSERISTQEVSRSKEANVKSKQCPDVCDDTCGNAIQVLMAEIKDLRYTRDLLLKVRTEANEIMNEVISNALNMYNTRKNVSTTSELYEDGLDGESPIISKPSLQEELQDTRPNV